MKYYTAKVGDCVGIDLISNNLYSAVDGALSRYNKFKNSTFNFNKWTFIVGDCGIKLNLSE